MILTISVVSILLENALNLTWADYYPFGGPIRKPLESGQKEDGMTEKRFDVLILGTGPAGLQAAIHAARRKVSVLVLGRRYKSSAFRAHIEK